MLTLKRKLIEDVLGDYLPKSLCGLLGYSEPWFEGREEIIYDNHGEIPISLTVLPDGRVASCSHKSNFKIWDIGAGEVNIYGKCFDRMALLSDGNLIGKAGDSYFIWDVDEGKEIKEFEMERDWMKHFLVLPNDEIVSEYYNCGIRVWNAKSGIKVFALPKRRELNVTTCMTLLPNNLVAAGFTDKTIGIWNMEILESVSRIETGEFVTCLLGLPDGRIVVAFNNINIWNIDTKKCEMTFSGHFDRVTCMSLLPDGRIISGSQDGTLRIWNLETGRCEKILSEHENSVSCLVVLPDGRVVSGSSDNTIMVWS